MPAAVGERREEADRTRVGAERGDLAVAAAARPWRRPRRSHARRRASRRRRRTARRGCRPRRPRRARPRPRGPGRRSLRTTSGTSATRRSPSAVSFGTPIRTSAGTYPRARPVCAGSAVTRQQVRATIAGQRRRAVRATARRSRPAARRRRPPRGGEPPARPARGSRAPRRARRPARPRRRLAAPAPAVAAGAGAARRGAAAARRARGAGASGSGLPASAISACAVTQTGVWGWCASSGPRRPGRRASAGTRAARASRGGARAPGRGRRRPGPGPPTPSTARCSAPPWSGKPPSAFWWRTSQRAARRATPRARAARGGERLQRRAGVVDARRPAAARRS